ncbi:hypothetical protein V6N13_142818 [Hibiscus sabdariffa]|uniref:WAT1-related protein n=1 Tax=Hibiscus sabdariffa TaxID=183260 RepID=A0ABR2FFM0_9ROSI
MNSLGAMLDQAKPFLAVIFLQLGLSGMSLITKFALDQGLNQHVLVVYRHAIATLLIAPFAFVFDRPTMNQNLYYTGMKYTTATFSSAMANVLPAFAFLLAWIFKVEKVNIRKVHSQAKILGTIVTVGGAMVMTLISGPMLQLPWAKSNNLLLLSTSSPPHQHPIKGALMMAAGCFCCAAFIILQAITLKSYPAELSLTALICLAGTIEGSIVALAMEAGNAAAWSVHLDVKFLTAVYSGVVCSGIGYYVQGVIMKTRGPVFVTAFNPLSMVIVAILSSFILSEVLYLGRVLGAAVIVAGLYLVLWGKTKDQEPSDDNFETTASNDEKMIAIAIATDDNRHTTITPTVEPV